jgi:hypothetical protein
MGLQQGKQVLQTTDALPNIRDRNCSNTQVGELEGLFLRNYYRL